MKPAPSLKSKALRWLSQREQSRTELRRKLIAHALRPGAGGLDAAPKDRGTGARHGTVSQGSDGHTAEAGPRRADDVASEVDDLLDWLEANRFLSAERFIEARIHVRAPRFGTLRIRRELAEHGVELDQMSEEALAATELERARLVHARKFPDPPATAAEAARRARFLHARGFSPDAIRRVLRDAARRDSVDA